MTKKITKKTIEIFEQEYEALLVTESEWDGQRAMAYHCVTGLLVRDRMADPLYFPSNFFMS